VPTGMYLATPFAPKLQNGLIISGQVTIIEVRGKLRLVPLTIVLANALGRILALCPGSPYQGAGAASRHPLGESMSAAQLRRRILQLLGANNILVGFHLGWILTSIELQLPAHRVVELGEEPAFQHYVQDMSVKNGFTDDFFRGDQIPSFDRRWPAVFSGEYFSFGRGAAFAIRETFYFAALWNLFGDKICLRRRSAAVFRLKAAYVVGCGSGYDLEEFDLVCPDVENPPIQDLCQLGRGEASVRYSSTQLVCSDEQWFAHLSDADKVTASACLGDTEAEHSQFRASCVSLLHSADNVPDFDWHNPLRMVFEEPTQRCFAAMDVAFSSATIHHNFNVLVPWLNNAFNTSIA